MPDQKVLERERLLRMVAALIEPMPKPDAVGWLDRLITDIEERAATSGEPPDPQKDPREFLLREIDAVVEEVPVREIGEFLAELLRDLAELRDAIAADIKKENEDAGR